MKKPKKLYQYQGFNNYSIQNLKNNQIFFNSPLNFNDPYDCLHTIQLEPLSNNIIAKTFGETYNSPELSNLTKKLLDDLINKNELVAFFSILSQKKLDNNKIEGLNQIEIAIKDDTIFEQEKKEAAKFIKENINSITQKIIEENRSNVLSKYGISCFSEINNDLLMWAYYADGHKGFCLEFDTTMAPFATAKKVRYKKEAPIFSPELFLESDSRKNNDFHEIFLSTKFVQWKNEKVWRLIHKESGTKYTYSSKALTGIYFGTKIDPTAMEIILTILRSQNPFIKFYKMEKDPSKFKIHPLEINYLTHLEGQNHFLLEVISNFENRKFTLFDVLNNIKFPKSNIETYLENLVHLGTITKDDENYHINFQ